MISAPTKPPMKVESRDPKSIRYTPTEWAAIEAAARARGVEPSRFARKLSLMGLSMVHAQEVLEASGRVTA